MCRRDWKPFAWEPSENINLLEFPAYKQITILTLIIFSLLNDLKAEEPKLFFLVYGIIMITIEETDYPNAAFLNRR